MDPSLSLYDDDSYNIGVAFASQDNYSMSSPAPPPSPADSGLLSTPSRPSLSQPVVSISAQINEPNLARAQSDTIGQPPRPKKRKLNEQNVELPGRRRTAPAKLSASRRDNGPLVAPDNNQSGSAALSSFHGALGEMSPVDNRAENPEPTPESPGNPVAVWQDGDTLESGDALSQVCNHGFEDKTDGDLELQEPVPLPGPSTPPSVPRGKNASELLAAHQKATFVVRVPPSPITPEDAQGANRVQMSLTAYLKRMTLQAAPYGGKYAERKIAAPYEQPFLQLSRHEPELFFMRRCVLCEFSCDSTYEMRTHILTHNSDQSKPHLASYMMGSWHAIGILQDEGFFSESDAFAFERLVDGLSHMYARMVPMDKPRAVAARSAAGNKENRAPSAAANKLKSPRQRNRGGKNAAKKQRKQ